MTLKELVKLQPEQVRYSEQIMPFYIQEYKKAFFVEPRTCCGGFTPDFKKLQQHVAKGQAKRRSINLKLNKMANEEFKLKRKYYNKILTYRLDGRPFRVYGKLASQDFFANFLTFGSKEQLADRRAMFENIPKKWQPQVKPWSETALTKTSQDEVEIVENKKAGVLNMQQLRELTIKEIKQYAAGKDIEIPKTVRKKDDIIKHVLNQDLKNEPVNAANDNDEEE